MSDAHTPPEPPANRFCDLVMKGGITSGVVYPKAIAHLAKAYRFRSIGGTSAGAIAAAVTAAAEYRRRQTHGSREGFDILAQLPAQLQAAVPGRRGTRLLSLFQPQPGTRRLFSVLVFSLNRGKFGRLLAIVAGTLLAYWPATLAGVGLAAGLRTLGHADVLGTVLGGLFAIMLFVGLWLHRDMTARVVENGYGLCTGLTTDTSHTALTPWLHDLIQRTAGLGSHDDPLTFGKLWHANDPPQDPRQQEASTACGENKAKPIRSIDLQMFSTNLGHGRPYIFPLAEEDPSATHPNPARERLFFNPDELGRYLPRDVLDFMVAQSKPYVADTTPGSLDPSHLAATALGLRAIPEPKFFPVVLAARMSLSFPLLFAAVPLWAIDGPPNKQRHFRKCWFSDGGISSNFPMHLFDGLVPRWPTFGINLEPRPQEADDKEPRVYLPQNYWEGCEERWNDFGENQGPTSRLFSFLSAVLGTMQNWNDNSLARMPGVRDRIARISLKKSEGGMNLNMDADVIKQMVCHGETAAQALLERFASHGSHAQAEGWDEHRFVRLSVLIKMLSERAPSVALALEPGCPHATDYQNLVTRHWPNSGGAPPGYAALIGPQEAAALQTLIAELTSLSRTLEKPKFQTGFHSIPKAELRIRPPL